MGSLQVIDLDNLHKYSNIDFSTIMFNEKSREYVAQFDYVQLNIRLLLLIAKLGFYFERLLFRYSKL